MTKQFIIIMLLILGFGSRGAAAFWGSAPTDSASGLNVAAGFDINTITTIAARVMTPPGLKEQGRHTEMTVTAPHGTMTVVLGPWWFWEKQAITIAKNQELTVTGSLAQGKDGALYLFAQCLADRSTGEAVMLRSESGVPLWSQSGSAERSGTRRYGGSGSRSAAGTRSGGMGGGRR